MRQLPPTPLFFSVSALDFDLDPRAPEPMAWYGFLHQLFDGDLEALELLQEWFGYCLTGDTSQEKMMLIVGPRRGGKGTIARVLARLIGIGNVCGPTTSSLASHFGLQPLIGKTLAIVSDARFHGENIPIVVERLLCISGEDLATVDRKFLGSVTMKLPTRFMFLTNELPRLTDASGALAGRFVTLRLTESFYGKEDTGLTDRLLGELPGILNWAIEGWRRLHERGHFVVPTSVKDVVQEIEDLSSPVSAFVRDECVVGPGHRVVVDVLYDAWRRWCE
jgi:putative DNA primase/helicase